jgi:hypothetical protein
MEPVTGRCEQQRYHLWTITTFRLFIVPFGRYAVSDSHYEALWHSIALAMPLHPGRAGSAIARDAMHGRSGRSHKPERERDSIRARQRRTEGERSGGRSFRHPTGCGKWADQEQPTACWFDPAAKRKQRRRGPEQVDRWDTLRAALTEIVGDAMHHCSTDCTDKGGIVPSESPARINCDEPGAGRMHRPGTDSRIYHWHSFGR